MPYTINYMELDSEFYVFSQFYGPWGQPDMSYFRFTKQILNKKSIDVYNN